MFHVANNTLLSRRRLIKCLKWLKSKIANLSKLQNIDLIIEWIYENIMVHTYYVNHQNDPHQLKILYMHGGSWVAGPFKEHYQMMDQLATDYNAEVIAPIYPKVPQSGKRAT